MLTATLLAASAGLAAAATITGDGAPVGFRQELELGAGDVGNFPVTEIHNGGAAYNPMNYATSLMFTLEGDDGSDYKYTPLNGGECTQQTTYNEQYAADANEDITDDYCVLGASQTTATVSITVEDAGLTDDTVALDKSYVTFQDGSDVTQYVPVNVDAKNEAYKSFELSYPGIDNGNTTTETLGFVLPSLIFNVDTEFDGSRAEPWFKIDMDKPITEVEDALIGFCLHYLPIYATADGSTNLSPAECKAAAMLTPPQAGYFMQSVAGDFTSYNSAGWTGLRTNFNSTADTPLYVTPFVAQTAEGYFRVAMADTREPLSTSGLAPSLAVAGLVAAVAKMLA